MLPETPPSEPAPAPPAASSRALGAATAGLIALSCGEQVLYVTTRQSFPRDLNLAYGALPTIYEQISKGAWGDALLAAGRQGGWYNLLLALWLRAASPNGVSFGLFSVPWFALLLTAMALLARAWAGPRAALATTAVAAQMPVLVLSSRLGWIHIPEAALVLVATWALSVDAGLARNRTAALLALTGAGAIALRGSGILWMGALAGAALLSAGRGAPRVRGARVRAALVAAIWSLAVLAPLPSIRDYIAGKLQMHDRYATSVPALLPQLAEHLGAFVGACVALGALGWALHRARPTAPGSPARTFRAATLAAWIGGSFALYAIVRCGLDNFPLLYAGLALVAGSGLARLAPRAGPLLAVLPVAGWLWTTSARALEEATGPAPLLPPTRVASLLHSACKGRTLAHRCLIVTDQGLFVPQAEDLGHLELFLMQEPTVLLWGLHDRHVDAVRPDAFGSWDCGAADALWRQRWPQERQERERLIGRWGLVRATTQEVEGCTFSWWVSRAPP